MVKILSKPPRNDLGIPERIREIVSRQTSENSFAKKCGISPQLLRTYMSGSIPGADKLVAIAEAANVSLEWLALGTKQTNQGQQEYFKQSPSFTSKEAPQNLIAEAEEAKKAIDQLSALLETGVELQDWHAVGLVRRDLDALLSDIRRLYPDLARRVSSAKNGVA